jgi:hypothetical protein
MKATTSGRLYVSYNKSFSPVPGPGLPSFIAPSSAAYYKRFDKFELTYDGSPNGVADLTAIDYWSIPMSLETEKDGQKVGAMNGVKPGCTEKEIYNGLEKLSNPRQSIATAKLIIKAFADAGHPLPTDIQKQLLNPASGLVKDHDGNFVRIIGPSPYPPFGEPATGQFPGLPFTPYNTFLEYFQYLIDTFGSKGDKIAHLEGDFVGSTSGTTPPYKAQHYNFWASIDDDFNLTIEGDGTKVGKHTLVVKKWDLLNPATTFGANPAFYLDGVFHPYPLNNIYACIFGDFFGGLNIGAIGSQVKVNGKIVGKMTSSEWFAELPKSGKMFDKLWGSTVTNHWNQWAQVLNPLSDAYNFSYAERFSSPLLSINPNTVDTLTLTLLKADVNS